MIYMAFGHLCPDVLHVGILLLCMSLQQCTGGKMRVPDLPSNLGLTCSLCISCTPFGSSLHGSIPHPLQCSRSRFRRHLLRRLRLKALRNSRTINGQSSGFLSQSTHNLSHVLTRKREGFVQSTAKAVCRERMDARDTIPRGN